MRSAGSRLITITQFMRIPETPTWHITGILLRNLYVVCSAEDNIFVSICEVCPGADWVEREIRDYYAVTFLGQSEHNPLMLRAHDPAGVFLPVEKEVI